MSARRDRPRPDQPYRVLVLGGGPAGLATAAALQAIRPSPSTRPLQVTVVERSDRVGDSWRQRYDSLRLHTPRSLSGLPGRPIPRRYGRWVARDDLVRYLVDYAEQHAIDVALGHTATRVEHGAGGARWAVTVETTAADAVEGGQRWDADTVVLATGYTRVPVLPDWAGLAGWSRPLVHSAGYRSPEPYRGQDVLVVGVGNSAAEIATELCAVAGRVRLSVRTPPNVVRRTSLGIPSQVFGLALRGAPEPVANVANRVFRRVSVPDLGPYGLPAPTDGYSQFLRTRTVPVLDHGFVDRVRSGALEVVGAVADVGSDGVRLVDGAVLTPDAVVAATGYRPGLEPLVGHLGLLDDRGLPTVRGAATDPRLPGLHAVGVTVELTGLLREIGREARGVARAVSRELAASPR